MMQRQRNGFEYWQTFISNSKFGVSFVNPGSTTDITKINKESAVKSIMDLGANLRGILINEYKTDIKFVPSKIYQCNLYSLKGMTLYFYGAKIGDKFIYTQVSTDPRELLGNTFNMEDFKVFCQKYLLGAGAMACFVITASFIHSRL